MEGIIRAKFGNGFERIFEHHIGDKLRRSANETEQEKEHHLAQILVRLYVGNHCLDTFFLGFVGCFFARLIRFGFGFDYCRVAFCRYALFVCGFGFNGIFDVGFDFGVLLFGV